MLNALNELFPIAQTVNIGLSPDIAKDKRHGVAWVECVNGGVTQQSFLADKPERLVNPSMFVIRSMFHQIAKMGLYPRHLEIMINNKRTVYQFGRRRPILTQSM